MKHISLRGASGSSPGQQPTAAARRGGPRFPIVSRGTRRRAHLSVSNQTIRRDRQHAHWPTHGASVGAHKDTQRQDTRAGHGEVTRATQGKGNTQGGAPRNSPAMGWCLIRRARMHPRSMCGAVCRGRDAMCTRDGVRAPMRMEKSAAVSSPLGRWQAPGDRAQTSAGP